MAVNVIRDTGQAAMSSVNKIYLPRAVEADTRFQHLLRTWSGQFQLNL